MSSKEIKKHIEKYASQFDFTDIAQELMEIEAPLSLYQKVCEIWLTAKQKDDEYKKLAHAVDYYFCDIEHAIHTLKCKMQNKQIIGGKR